LPGKHNTKKKTFFFRHYTGEPIIDSQRGEGMKWCPPVQYLKQHEGDNGLWLKEITVPSFLPLGNTRMQSGNSAQIGSVFAVDCFVAAVRSSSTIFLASLRVTEISTTEALTNDSSVPYPAVSACFWGMQLSSEFDFFNGVRAGVRLAPVLLKAKPHCPGENRYHTCRSGCVVPLGEFFFCYIATAAQRAAKAAVFALHLFLK
jgi:hypothetical protein